MKKPWEYIGCVGHDCDECKRNKRIIAAARRWWKVARKKDAWWNEEIPLARACDADAAAKRKRRK